MNKNKVKKLQPNFIDFPASFFWGGAISAEQSEGLGTTKKGKTIYQVHYEQKPQDFWKQMGPDKTIEATKNYQQDIALIKKIGFNSHRTSLSWARLFPDGNYEKPNQAAVKYYHAFIAEFAKHNITLFLTLFHFDLPQYALDKGGFESREVWDDFLKYAQFVLTEFGSKVKYWTTMNEFWVPVQTGYLNGIHPPFIKDEQRAVNAAYGIVMAHAKVVNYFNKHVKNKYPDHEIGGIFNSVITYPKDVNNPADVKAAHYLNMFQFTGLTDAAINGKWDPQAVAWIKKLNLMPQNYAKGDLAILAKIKLDFIGLNFYAPARAQAPTSNYQPANKFETYFQPYQLPKGRENKCRGWEIYPQAVYDTLVFMYHRYGQNKHKYMLTEYGVGIANENYFRDQQGQINDAYRIAFLKEHLTYLHQFMNEYDVTVMGAHLWSVFDCWSWTNAFKNTYGLIEVNLTNQKRRFKKSAHFFQELILNHGFSNDNAKFEDYYDEKSLKK